MAVEWIADERPRVEDGLKRHPIESGRCAALARVVFAVGRERDDATCGRQVRPHRTSAARYVVPQRPNPPLWFSHTYVETHAHAVDALTGIDGTPASTYLRAQWRYPEALEVHEVDVATIDANIEGEP